MKKWRESILKIPDSSMIAIVRGQDPNETVAFMLATEIYKMLKKESKNRFSVELIHVPVEETPWAIIYMSEEELEHVTPDSELVYFSEASSTHEKNFVNNLLKMFPFGNLGSVFLFHNGTPDKLFSESLWGEIILEIPGVYVDNTNRRVLERAARLYIPDMNLDKVMQEVKKCNLKHPPTSKSNEKYDAFVRYFARYTDPKKTFQKYGKEKMMTDILNLIVQVTVETAEIIKQR